MGNNTDFPEFVSYPDYFKEMECGLFIFMSLMTLGRNGKDWQGSKECFATNLVWITKEILWGYLNSRGKTNALGWT